MGSNISETQKHPCEPYLNHQVWKPIVGSDVQRFYWKGIYKFIFAVLHPFPQLSMNKFAIYTCYVLYVIDYIRFDLFGDRE